MDSLAFASFALVFCPLFNALLCFVLAVGKDPLKGLLTTSIFFFQALGKHEPCPRDGPEVQATPSQVPWFPFQVTAVCSSGPVGRPESSQVGRRSKENP